MLKVGQEYVGALYRLLDGHHRYLCNDAAMKRNMATTFQTSTYASRIITQVLESTYDDNAVNCEISNFILLQRLIARE